MRRLLILPIVTLFCIRTHAQQLDPKEYVYPIRGVSGLYSANFGEIRPGHFHAGIDIKTDGCEGRPILAAADGYVSRVAVTPGGYGRALYITLRNGKTAVYGHLRQFRSDIEEQVKTERYRCKSNSADLHFTPGQFPVKQGEAVGYSGNSGSSFGPHLHYELRDTPSQRYLNIVKEGVIRPTDNLPPRIMKIHYVEIDSVQGTCMQAVPESYAVVRNAPGRYRLTRQEPVETGRKGYFVAEITDRRNNVGNTFGIWRLTAYVDGQRYFEYRMDGFTPELSRFSDAVSYYPLQTGSRNEVIRLSQLAETPGCFYTAMEERGTIRTAEGQQRRIRLEAEDDRGNISSLEFDIRGRSESFSAAPDSTGVLLRPEQPALVNIGRGMKIEIPSETLFESLFCYPQRPDLTVKPDSGVVVLSPVYQLFETSTPLRKAVKVSIHAPAPLSLQPHTALARRLPNGSLTYLGGSYYNTAVNAETRATGPLIAVADTLPPHIRPLFADGADLSKTESIRFRAGDNFSGIASCTLQIDEAWVPCDRFPIQGTLLHTFDTPARGRRHTVRLTVTDGCGNTARWIGTFYR